MNLITIDVLIHSCMSDVLILALIGRRMSANGDDKENVDNEMQDKDDKQSGDKGKSRKKKDKKGGQ